MKKTLLIGFSLLSSLIGFSQNWGIDDGDRTDCSFSFFDSGMLLSNYGNNEDHVITICPDVPGNYVSITWTTFQLEDGFDYLLVVDGGPDGNIVGGYTNTNTPPNFTSSDPSGCLTFRFISDGSVNRPGWSALITCSATIGGDIGIASSSQDCSGGGGATICDNSTLSGNSSGAGNLNDFVGAYADDGCLGGENQTSWYYFRLDNGGTFGFDLDPAAGDDYDFAIWGPYPEVECPIVTGDAPLRCSFAAGSTNTGLDNSTAQTSEGIGGDGWVSDITGATGDTYVMVIDNYSATGNPFDLTWSLSGGASLDCTTLPVEFFDFSGKKLPSLNRLEWSTASEKSSDYFIVERSDNSGVFKVVSDEIKAAGNSSEYQFYSFEDETPYHGLSYYRIKQYDFDGNMTASDIITIDRSVTEIEIAQVYPNPFDNSLMFQVFSSQEKKADLKIIGADGRIVHHSNMSLNQGQNTMELGRDLNSGIYMIQFTVEGSDELQSMKIVKN